MVSIKDNIFAGAVEEKRVKNWNNEDNDKSRGTGENVPDRQAVNMNESEAGVDLFTTVSKRILVLDHAILIWEYTNW